MLASQGIEINFFIRLADDADDGQHGNGLALLVRDQAQDALLGRLDIKIGFVRFDFEQRRASLDRVAFFFQPGDDLALGHALSGFGHQDWVSHFFRSLG